MLWMDIAAVFAVLNVALVLALLGLYFQSWRNYRSSVSVGLMTFSVFFLVQNVVIVVFWSILYGLVPSAQDIVATAAPYLTVINAMETIALANLLRITWA